MHRTNVFSNLAVICSERTMKKYFKTISIAVFTLFISQVNAGVTVIDFDTDSNGDPIVNGQVIDTELGDVTLTVNNNYGAGANYGVAFDTLHDSVQDEDLEFHGNGNAYDGTEGNTNFRYTELVVDNVGFGATPGNILIMQNTDQYNSSLDGCDTGICDNPNDENGTNPAGYFEFNFGQLVDIISLDTFDIEDNGEFVIQFFANNLLVATRTESSLNGNTTAKAIGQDVSIYGSADYTVQAGDNTLQTMNDGQFVRQLLNISGIDMMRIQLPGSGAIDNLAFRTAEVSAPATLGILSLGLLMMIRRSRK